MLARGGAGRRPLAGRTRRNERGRRIAVCPAARDEACDGRCRGGFSACLPPAGNRAEELGMAARRPLDDAGRRLSAAARRGAGVLSLRRGAAAGRVVRSLCTLRQDAARGAARRLGGGHQFGIETDLSRPLRARSPAGLSGGRGLRHDCEGSRAPLRDVGRRGRRAGAGHEIQSEILCRGFGGRGDARRGQRRNGDQTRRRRPHRAAPPGRAGEARQAYGIDRNLRAGSSSWTNASTRSSPTSKNAST